jgi:hypothetical protein
MKLDLHLFMIHSNSCCLFDSFDKQMQHFFYEIVICDKIWFTRLTLR